MAERIKQNSYKLTFAKLYLWRTMQQQGIDHVEQNGLTLTVYEFKWNPKAKAKFSRTFLRAYDTGSKLINRSNFREFVTIPLNE